MDEFSVVGKCLRRNILLNYLLRVRIKINVHRERAMQMHVIRKDCQMIKMSQFKDHEADKQILVESNDHINDEQTVQKQKVEHECN